MTKTGEERCPCCNGIHAREIRTLVQTITVEGEQKSYPVSVSYCPFVSEYYETGEQLRKNIQTFRNADKGEEEKIQYISQEKITELLLKYKDNRGDICTNAFIALHGQ